MVTNESILGPLWAEYRAIIVPDAASDTQIRETGKAFYAGAAVMYKLLTTASVLHPGADVPTGVAFLAQLQKELKASMGFLGEIN